MMAKVRKTNRLPRNTPTRWVGLSLWQEAKAQKKQGRIRKNRKGMRERVT
jgi:hypothetical protein